MSPSVSSPSSCVDIPKIFASDTSEKNIFSPVLDTCPDTQSEDCLYINVFVPRASNMTTKVPVAIFLPGGNYRQGGIGTPLYDGGPMVATGNVILVTSAYRYATTSSDTTFIAP
jgi:carboxylesterase type B